MNLTRIKRNYLQRRNYKMENIFDLDEKLKLINDEIKKFDTDERKEIKKNNKLIDTYISELEVINQVLLNEIKNRYDSLVPIENKSLLDDDKSIDELFDKIRFLSDNNYVFKMRIDKNLYEIKYEKSLDVINENIVDLIGKFSYVGIKLNKDDFKYSMSLYKYMSHFFDNREQIDFDTKIRDVFDSIYWECPEIINHIYLCFMLLLEKNKDKFENYIKSKYNENLGYDLELDNYYKAIISKEEIVNRDEYRIYQKFSNGELRVEEYLNDSVNKKEIITKFIDYDKYNSLTADERMRFYEQIIVFYRDLCEYMWINKYCYLIDKVKEIYLNKNSYVNNYNSFVKTLKSLNKQREALMKKILFIYNQLNKKSNDRLLKKYNNLFNKINLKIDEIISNYANYDEIVFVNDIIKKLNDDSTYFDVFKIVEGNYGYVLNLMNDKEGNYNEFIDYLYNPYLNISKSIPFLRDINIEDKLIEKYDLFDMKVNLSDKNKLREDLEYIIRLGYFEKNNIEIEKFKLIFDIKKIIEN